MRVWEGEVYDTDSKNEAFWLDVTIFPVVNHKNELYEYLVICSNITSRKLTEHKLKSLNEKKFLLQEEEQTLKSKSIIEGQETERKRMAIEIHDGVGQMLTALKFSCEALETKDDRNNEILTNIKKMLQEVIKETRRISSNLLPTVLNDFGLPAGVNDLVTGLMKLGEVEIDYQNETDLEDRLTIQKEIAAYRITQEALNNAMKHAKADQIDIKMTNDAEYLYISIEDNGQGFISSKSKKNSNQGGNGLRNMQERTKLIEGNIYINSALNKGTQVFLEVPL